MSLRHRLTYLLVAFAAFAALSAFATIWGIRLQVAGAIDDFQEYVDQTDQVHHLRRLAAEQVLQLTELLEGRRDVTTAYVHTTHEFFAALSNVARLARSPRIRIRGIPQAQSDPMQLLSVAADLEKQFEDFRTLVQQGRYDQAAELLSSQIDGRLVPALLNRLREIEVGLERTRDRSVSGITTTATHTVLLTMVVGALGTGLVFVGAALIRRWVFEPLALLNNATKKLQDALKPTDCPGAPGWVPPPPITLTRDDELGDLASALNSMAASVSTAQRELQESDAKHRMLFENLRDAVVICDRAETVVEFHDCDSQILGEPSRDPVGRQVLDVWPEWRGCVSDWSQVIKGVVSSGRRFRAVDVELPARDGGGSRVVDLVIYPLQHIDGRCAVIVIRDVSERHELQSRLRHAEIMKATGTLASGIAHDVNSVLTNAIGNISVVEEGLSDPEQQKRLAAALRACWQAAGLARRILNFAGAQGTPRVIDLGQTMELILDSLTETSLGSVRVTRSLARDVKVRIDQDQLTQAVLNLIQNACDAMSESGNLHVSVRWEEGHEGTKAMRQEDRDRRAQVLPPPFSASPSAGEFQNHERRAVLTVKDDGCGMSREVRERMYDPFYTTKPRDNHRGRGLGMTMVYSAVKNADGVMIVESEPGAGTQISLHFPAADTPAGPTAESQ